MTDLSTLDPAQKRALLAERLRQGTTGATPRHAPLSPAQQRLWFIDQMEPGQPVYTIAVALRLSGPLDAGRLSAALDRIGARHESLRTRFTEAEGAPVQVVEPSARLLLTRHDIAEGDLPEALAGFAAAPFDLAAGPLVRCALFRLAPETHVLAVAVHHIVADYRSLQIMIAELKAFYEGRDMPPPALQYPDHALSQRARSTQMETQAAYWREALAGLPPLLDLPTDHPRPARACLAGGRHAFALPPELSRRIDALARQRGVTPFTVLLAGFHVLHARYSGEGDICIGTTVSNRDQAALQTLVGYLVNTLPLRLRVAPGDGFATLLGRLHGVVADAMAHQEIPFERIVEVAAAERSLAHAPVFQSMFNLHEKQPARFAIGDLSAMPEHLPKRSARFDLCLDLFHGEEVTGVLEYATALFEPERAARMAADYVRILDAAIADPDRPVGEISLLDAADRELLERCNDTARALPETDLATLIADQAAHRGDAVALIAGTTRLSHAELDAAASRLAARLAPEVGKGDRLAICLPRSADLVIALLAALKLGAVYVPLDPTHPERRLRHILDEAAPRLILTCGAPPAGCPCPALDLASARDEIASLPPHAPARRIGPDDLAYIIFTSGTTGRPKGVPIRRDSLVNLLSSMARHPGMDASDTLLAVTTPAFDIAALELFLPLFTGGTLVLAEADTVIDGAALSALIEAADATIMQATPATWRLLDEAGWRAPDGFRMLSGGEALDVELARSLLSGQGQLWNLYGPTETTIWSTLAEITIEDCDRNRIPMGLPVDNTTLHVLDAGGLPCPPGVPGELHIGGLGLSPGYLDRPELTADRFVEIGGTRLYRTGDRVMQDADGQLFHLGRLDFQVKLRGFRIELGEIEALISADPAIDEAVVALRGDGDEAALIAYLRSSVPIAEIEPRLRAQLEAHLPRYMMPAAFVRLDAMPLNRNGKIDRARLPEPERGLRPDAPPATGTEALLSRLWAELLGMDAPGREADFFALGGHSLLAMRMVARLPHAGPRAAPLRLLFEAPRLSGFAAALDRAGILTETPRAPIPSLPADTPRPLSFAQERQWTLAALDPGQAVYNIPAALRLDGAIDPARLGHAFTLLAERHQILRSRYPAQAGRPRVEIDTAPDLTTRHIPGSDLDEAIRAEAALPFDLATGPLARLTLFHVDQDDHALLLMLDHIVADAESVQMLLRELMELYLALGHDPNHRPAPLPVQYTDYAAWQRGQDVEAELDYWVRTLDGAPPLLDMPTDFPRPARQDFTGGSVDFAIADETAAGLRGLASESGATPFMALLSLYAAFLGRYAGAQEVVIGTPVTQRSHSDLEKLAGLFVNSLALRLPCGDPGGTPALIAQCRDRVLDGFAHQDAPFERIVDALSPERTWSHNPIFQTMFVWRVQESAPRDAEGLAWRPLHPSSATAKMDLQLSVLDRGTDFALRFEYRRDLFRPQSVEHLAASFGAFVAAAVAAPKVPAARLSLLHPEQARQISLWRKGDPVPKTGAETLHGRISARAALAGEAVAIRDATHAITYAALERRSDILAAHLQGMGIGPGKRVGIALPRRIDLVTAILAVLKTGAAYVPLDPRYPAERIDYITEDAGLSLVLSELTAEGTLDLTDFWDGPPGVAETRGGIAAAPAGVSAQGSDLAYLIYTSGSTGRPKGVALTHGSAATLVRWAEATFGPETLAGVLFSTSVCFDLSVFEIFSTLSAGGTLYVVDDLFALPEAPFAGEVTLVNTVPTPMAELLRLGPLPAAVRTVCLAGEPLPSQLADKILAQDGVDLWNLYGPSEDTTYSTGIRIRPGDEVTIGRPVAGSRVHVLDEAMQDVPPGLPGELCLSGPGIARGYWNRPGQTADAFVPNPHAGKASTILYRTGDRVRWRIDGTIEYMGRGDRQVKVRGFRVEPGEVEAALTALPGVAAAAVGLWDGRLAAWLEGTAPGAALAEALSQRLPAHLVPTLYKTMDTLPRLPNGKLDRGALPDPAGATMETPAETAPPRPGTEAQLALIWRQVLGRGEIGREEPFFAIGGDSILAIQVVARAREAGLPLSPRDLFQAPTIARLAEAVAGRDALGAAQGPVTGMQPLTPIQRWFLGRDIADAHHWNQAMVLAPTRTLDPDMLERALTALADRHDTLRARFTRGAAGWVQRYGEPGARAPLIRAQGNVTEAAQRMQAEFDLAGGPVWGAVLCETEGGQRLAIAAHHLVVDGVSWRILLSDLQNIYLTLAAGGDPHPPRRGTSPGAWAEFLATNADIAAERPFWEDMLSGLAHPLPLDAPQGSAAESEAARVETRIDGEITRRMIEEVPAAYPVSVPELLAAALSLALRDATGADALIVEMESHGRPDLSDEVDLTRSVGWLTALYPVRLEAKADPAATLRGVKDVLRRIPRDGVGYGVLRHLRGEVTDAPRADVRFNYLGQTGAIFGQDALFRPAAESAGAVRAPAGTRDVTLEANAIVHETGLKITWTHTARLAPATVERIGESFARHLDALVAHCLTGTDAAFTPSDFPDMDFGQDDLDDLLQSLT